MQFGCVSSWPASVDQPALRLRKGSSIVNDPLAADVVTAVPISVRGVGPRVRCRLSGPQMVGTVSLEVNHDSSRTPLRRSPLATGLRRRRTDGTPRASGIPPPTLAVGGWQEPTQPEVRPQSSARQLVASA